MPTADGSATGATVDRLFLLQCRGNLVDVVAEHLHVGGSRSLFVGQRLDVELAARLRLGRGGDLLDELRIVGVLEEVGLDVLGLDLVDQLGDVGSRRLGFGRKADRCQELDLVFPAEIAEGVVAGEDLALVVRYWIDFSWA